MISTERPAMAAFWCSGGAIVGRRCVLSREEAHALLTFYVGQGEACRRAGDEHCARFCRRRGHDLALAIRSSDNWARAAGREGARIVRKPHEF
jgi:hypothetical protein